MFFGHFGTPTTDDSFFSGSLIEQDQQLHWNIQDPHTKKCSNAILVLPKQRGATTMVETESSEILTDENVNSDAETKQRSGERHSGHGSGVSFGSVHVHEHRMTLGSNPEVRRGVPVELAWEVEQSEVFSTVDEFEEKAHADGRDSGNARRIAAWKREAIAEAHHSRESIVRVTNEIQAIQQNRHDSQRDSAAKHVVSDLQKEPHTTIMPPSTKASFRNSNEAQNSKGGKRRFLCCWSKSSK